MDQVEKQFNTIDDSIIGKALTKVASERDYYKMLLDRHGKCICNLNPATTDGPQEFCPWHGRSYTEILEWGDKLTGRTLRVRALHCPVDVEVLDDECAERRCNHKNDCPRKAIKICKECDRIATEASSAYFGTSLVYGTYPCNTIKTLEDE